jgi:hypothetical protein
MPGRDAYLDGLLGLSDAAKLGELNRRQGGTRSPVCQLSGTLERGYCLTDLSIWPPRCEDTMMATINQPNRFASPTARLRCKFPARRGAKRPGLRTAFGGLHDHGAIGNYIVSDKPLTQEESEKLRAGPCLSGAVEIAAEVRDRPPLFIVTYSPKAPQKWPERTS